MSSMDKKTNRGNDAIDALIKIRALLLAAGHLTSGDDETDLMFELIDAAENVINRVLESDK